MGATSVDVTNIGINESVSQQDTSVTGALTDLRGVDIKPTTTLPNDNPSIQKINGYDVIVATANAAGPTTVNIASKTITVAKSIGTPVQVTNFFASLLTTGSPKLHAIKKVNKNGNQDYEIIYTNEGTGAVTLDLFIVTLEVPVGAVAPTFPTLPATTDPLVTDVVLREDNGLVRIYDYFMLSTQ